MKSKHLQIFICLVVMIVVSSCKTQNVDKAIKSIKEGDAETAEQLLKEAIRKNPYTGEASFWLGKLRYRERDYEKAIDLFIVARKSEELSKQNEAELDTLFNTLTNKILNKGLQFYNMSLKPEFVLRKEGLLDSALVYLKTYANNTSDLNKNDGMRAMFSIAMIRKDIRIADMAFSVLKKDDRLTLKDYNAYAEVNIAVGQPAAAIKIFEQSQVKSGNTSEYKKVLANLYIKINKHDNALSILNTAVLEYANDLEFGYLQGVAYQQSQRYLDAMDAYDRVLLLDPYYKEIVFNYGYCAVMNSGQNQIISDTSSVNRPFILKAISHLERIAPKAKESIAKEYLDLLSLLYVKAGKNSDAEATILRIRKQPTN